VTALSELCALQGLDLRRDAQVHSLGFVEIPLEGRLVFAIDESTLALAMAAPGVAAVLTSPALSQRLTNSPLGLALAADPKRAFVELHNSLASRTQFYGTPHTTHVDPTAQMHRTAHIDEQSVSIGADCMLDAGAIVLSGSRIARGARIMSGAVLGSDGFQTMRFADAVIDLRHMGEVEIGARTVVMANAVIARAVFRQATRIGEDCRIGNGAFVSHNVQIGAGSFIGHGAVIAGNTRIGERVTIGPGAICLDRLSIGDGAFVTAGAVVTKAVERGQRVSGNFAVPHNRFLDFVKRVAKGQYA
jgi:UDP-3-O-[3-hydroxymyristoyl] glucosamine N-acyltransferase